MIKIFGIKNCSTMKKAFDHLNQMQVPYEFHDYKKQGIDKALISNWVDAVGIDKVLNKKGMTWRNFSDEQKFQANADTNFAIELMSDNPSVIKRPIVVKEGSVIVGYDEQIYRGLK